MKLYSKSLLIITILAVLLILGCSDRTVETTQIDPLQEGGIAPQNHVFFDEFLYQINNEFNILRMVVYIPRVSFPSFPPSIGGNSQPVPLLVLLTPEDANEYYYFNQGLKGLADELISNGTIQPMAIACISNDRYVGGMFYAGHYNQAGDYDALVSGSLIEFLNRNYPFIIDSPEKRGIGGIGQGAYGALRTNIINPGTYTSVSVADGPLDFDGADGNSGFIPYFDDAMMEQGLLDGDITKFKIRDSMLISRTFIGGAYAFSPQDTTLFISFHSFPDNAFLLDSTYMVGDTTGDSVSMVPVGLKTPYPIYSYHLPFDSTGAPHPPVWNDLWLPNNLENLLTPGVLNGINVWIGTSIETEFLDYHNQTQSFINTLSSEYPVEVYNYVGYDGKPAERGIYLYDLMKEMLIFHSESFGD